MKQQLVINILALGSCKTMEFHGLYLCLTAAFYEGKICHELVIAYRKVLINDVQPCRHFLFSE